MMNKAPDCPTCGKSMVLREGVFGKFYGCSRYPNCDTTVSLKDVHEKFNQAVNFHSGNDYGICKRCGENDTLSDMRLCNYCQHIWDKD